MHPLIERLAGEAPVLTDGAWGTQMQARGLPIGACPDAWNLSEPAKVESVARAYVDAGSRIILTNTFGANRFVLARHDLQTQAAEINHAGAVLSKRAAEGTTALVFASIGPSGKMLMMDEVTEDELRAAFVEQAQALAAGGADAIVVETMSDLDEACIALEAAKATGLPVVVSMTYDTGKDKDRTMMGTTPEQAVARLEDAGADVIGANCGQGIEGYVPIAARLRKATTLPVWIKANAGLPELVDDKAVYRTSAEQFASFAPAVVSAGATFIGGCCGSSPDFIQALKKNLFKTGFTG
jgi:methionine synthase I (cobalamin-dependent)